MIISDIHGCSLEFQALLRIAGLNRSEDRLVILGDLFDRGHHSYEVFRSVRKLKAEMGERFIFVRGNHDQFLLDFVRDRSAMSVWAYNGGVRTAESFEAHGMLLSEPAAFIEAAPLYYETEQWIGVHTGLKSEIPSENDPEVLMWDRSVAHGAYTGKLGIGGHTPMNEPVWFLPDGTHLVLKYDTRLPLPDRGFMIIDTGCVFGGRLTALIIEGGEFYLKQMRKRDY